MTNNDELVEDEPKQNYNCPCIHPSQCDGSCMSEIECRAEELEAMADVIMDSGKAGRLEAKVAMERAAKLLRSLAVATPPAVPTVERKAEPVAWPNGCDRTAVEALRYLSRNERPLGGEQRFNRAHLNQIADELESMASRSLYSTPPAAPVTGLDADKVMRAVFGDYDAERNRTCFAPWKEVREKLSAALSAPPSPVDSRELLERLVKAAEKTLDNRATMISASGDGRPYVTITFDTLAEMHRFTGGMAELRAALAAKEQQP